jgi:hypothetical protein
VKPRADNYEEEDDPYFYHLDLDNYEDSLETFCNDNFYAQDARLHSNRDQVKDDILPINKNSRNSSLKNAPIRVEKSDHRLELPLVSTDKTNDSQRKSMNTEQD